MLNNIIINLLNIVSGDKIPDGHASNWNYKNLFILSICVCVFIIIVNACILKYKNWKIEKLEEENKELQKEIKELTKKE